MTLFKLFFKVILYFLVLTDFLSVFALAVILGVAFLTVTLTVVADLTYLLFPLNVIVVV